MASTHAHVPLHVYTYHEIPPSPTLTNPDMILPFDESTEVFPSLSAPPSSTTIQADLVSNASFDSNTPSTRPRGDSDAEVGIATAVALPMLVRGPVATTISAVPSAVIYQGYEHGAPLSDIGEEVEETTIRSRESSPDRSGSSLKQGPPLRHKKRLSNLSTSSGGSDKNDNWEEFDTSQLMSDRVAADIADARDAAEKNEDSGSRRNSKDVEDELTVLNDRAEKILANARKRLSSMEDNLTKARHSILLSPRSIPNMHELGHQPAGGLYRSISQNAHNRRSRGLFPSLKVMGLQHARTGSEMSTSTGLRRLSGVPEPRSASAMDFSPARYGVGFITTETKSSPSSKIAGHSPSSSRSYNSPLRILSEDAELQTPSTVKTSPDTETSNASTFLQTRGLGIHASGTKAQEDLSQVRYESSESPSSMHRSSSQASTRSAKELKDQMSEMKNRISELKNKAQAETLRRRSLQNLRTPSPFLNSNVNGQGAEGRYSGEGPSNHHQQSTTSSSQPSNTSTSDPRLGHERKDSAIESLHGQPIPQQVVHNEVEPQGDRNPVTPTATRLLNVIDGTPIHPSSARTDRNTPNLVNRTVDIYEPAEQQVKHEYALDPNSEDVEQELGTSEDDDEQIAKNEEEQIYLNEVLEESLHDVEAVPPIPGEYLVGAELMELQGEEAQRHEDRLDAFDYENMFLHSAMGTYRGDDASDSDDDSLVTSREDVRTPHAGQDDEEEEEDDDDSETVSGEERSNKEVPVQRMAQMTHIRQTSSPLSGRGTATPVQSLGWSPIRETAQGRSPMNEPGNDKLRASPQSWVPVARTKSMETVSSLASFRTAVEGEGDDDEEDEDFHDEILNWGNAPPHHHISHQKQYLPGHGVSAKAQNVLGWPTPPVTQGQIRHSSYVRPQQIHISASHLRSASGGSSRSVPGRSPPAIAQFGAFPFPASAPTQPPPTQPLPPPPPQAQAQVQASQVHSQAAVSHQANTEILMESLIKLADPEFSIESTGRSNFADIDKELVLGLLRAVGGVCDGVLRAQNGRRGNAVKELRTRLVSAREVLVNGVSAGMGVGMAVSDPMEQEGLSEIMEDDEDEESF